MAAHRLIRRVPEEPHRGGVPTLNLALQGLADDRVVRVLDDRREQAGGQKLLRAFRLETASASDVAEDQHAAGDLAFLIPDRRCAIVDWAVAAVPRDQHGMVREADD